MQTQAPALGTVQQGSSQAVRDRLQLESQANSGAGWFYWIAGLSLLNTILIRTGAQWVMVFGLGITGVVDYLAKDAGAGGQILALAFNAVAMGLFILFGYFARKRQKWAYYTGMTIYALDGALMLVGQDWLGVGVHALALFFIFNGLKAANKLENAPATAVA